MRIAVIGAGMSGILATIKLAEAGYDDVVVYEKADRVGGTWRENTYPGLACDVPSHLYSYSFEPNPEWSHPYSPGPEIQAYFEGVAARQAVLDRTVFGAEITSARWRDARWGRGRSRRLGRSSYCVNSRTRERARRWLQSVMLSSPCQPSRSRSRLPRSAGRDSERNKHSTTRNV